jgi:nicotinate phosphoribosyltransferase
VSRPERQTGGKVLVEERNAVNTVSTVDDQHPGEPLLHPVMRDGRRCAPPQSLAEIRAHAARCLSQLPDALRDTRRAWSCPVTIALKLVALAAEVDRFIAAHDGSA